VQIVSMSRAAQSARSLCPANGQKLTIAANGDDPKPTFLPASSKAGSMPSC